MDVDKKQSSNFGQQCSLITLEVDSGGRLWRRINTQLFFIRDGGSLGGPSYRIVEMDRERRKDLSRHNRLSSPPLES